MANYILLIALNPEGQRAMLANPDSVAEAAANVRVPDVTGLGLYGVLGPYDFVGIIQAPDNESAARYSIQLGVGAGARITTLPAVPISLLHERGDPIAEALMEGAELIQPRGSSDGARV